MSDSERDILRGFVSILSGDIGALLVGLAITPIIVRLLGSSQYGEYAFLLSLLSVLLVVTNGGIGDGIRKFIAEQRGGRWEEDVFVFYVRLSIVLGLIGAACLLALTSAGVIRGVLGGAFESYFALLALLLLTRQLFLTFRSTLMGLGYEHRSEPLLILQKLLFGGIAVALLLGGWGVEGMLAGHIVASLIVSLLALWLVSRLLNVGYLWRVRSTETPARELLSFNALSVLLTILMTSLYHVDILLLQLITGSQTTGHYRAALLVAEFVWFVPFALQIVLLHSTADLWARDDREKISSLASRATRYTVALTLLIALGIAALAEPFVRVYFGAEFSGISGIILLLLPGAFGFAVARPIIAISQSKGTLRTLVGVTALVAGLNICLNVLLIPEYGMVGAAAATSLSYGLMLLVHVGSARRLGYNPLDDLRAARILVTVLVATPVIFGVASLLRGALSLLLVPPVGGLVYAVVAIKTGVTSSQELEPAANRLPAPLDDSLLTTIRILE